MRINLKLYSSKTFAAASLLFAAAGVAHAAESGFTNWGSVNVAGKGTTGVQINSGITLANSRPGAWPAHYGAVKIDFDVPPGWLGLSVYGFKDGAMCDWYTEYSTFQTKKFSNTALRPLCSPNEDGTPSTYRTAIGGLVWNGTSEYHALGPQYSPSFNFPGQ